MRGIVQTLAYLLADAFVKSENGYRFLERFEDVFHDADLPTMPKEWEGVKVTIEVIKAKPLPFHPGYIMNKVSDWIYRDGKKGE